MRRLFAATAALAGCLALATVPALSASAAPSASAAQSHVTASTSRAGTSGITARSAKTAIPLYSQDIDLSIKCATWRGEVAWGGNGSILVPAYIDVSGTLHDTCRSGYAQLFLHWDTIDNPKNVLVKKVNAGQSARTPYSTHDDVNTYKDIYVYICSEYEGYRCSAHKGPGA